MAYLEENDSRIGKEEDDKFEVSIEETTLGKVSQTSTIVGKKRKGTVKIVLTTN